MQRPLKSAELKIALQHVADSYKVAHVDPQRVGAIAATLETLLGKTRKRVFVAWLTEGATESLKEVAPSMIAALERWLKPVYNRERKEYQSADEYAEVEAGQAVHDYLVSIGQLSFFE